MGFIEYIKKEVNKEFITIDNMTFKEFFIDRTKLYFKPLKEKWFWVYAMPIIVILSFLLPLVEHS